MKNGATKTLLKTLTGENVSPPPIWLMRQAGRYLPEYRETRAQAGGFLDLCYSPALAEEVTLQPIRRFGFDAAILFADILLLPQAMGRRLWFETGEGPRLDPLTEAEGVAALDVSDAAIDRLAPVFETVARLSRSLPSETALIGFAGAPWTVATYMAAGRGKDDQAGAKALIARDPDLFAAMMDKLERATIAYALRQIDSGAEAFKLFDTWASAFIDDEASLERWVVAPARRILDAVREARPGVPVLYFPRGVGRHYPAIARAVAPDGLAIDHSTTMEWAAANVPQGVALQGNLDPACVATRRPDLEAEARAILDAMRGRPFIFNLGHGITPDADPEAVKRLVEIVRTHG
jgi:uroporphyrinogen decarboxylase